MTAEPIVLARFCQEWLELVALENEPFRSRFFERVPPEFRAQIDKSLASHGCLFDRRDAGRHHA